MTFKILTLFPEIIEAYFKHSIMAKAVEKGLVDYQIINIRDFAHDRHKTCDDAPYGGGAGMVFKPEPLGEALDFAGAKEAYTIYPSPSGSVFHQQMAEELASKREIILICGRYEGIDQRIIDEYVDKELCVGDFVMSSGEVAALAIIDSVYRLCDGVIRRESLEEESFQDNLLEYPLYTRPETYKGDGVPDVLLSGHHAKIEDWRLKKRLIKTALNRPDLFQKVEWDKHKRKIWDEYVSENVDMMSQEE